MTHTKGPWHITGRPDLGEMIVFGPEGTRRQPDGLYAIATISDTDTHPYHAENLENASLLASAPELRRILVRMIDVLDNIYSDTPASWGDLLQEAKDLVNARKGG